jgi:deferrochelatase/peroxidase EfeB
MQNQLARDYAMSEYLKHTGSALFAVPPGIPGPGEHIGQGLFDRSN